MALPHTTPLSLRTVERLARRLAELEVAAAAKMRAVIETERKIVGDTDRWVVISKTSPSGKTQFVCRSCGAVSPAPNKRCAQPVKLWNGEMRECADWEPPKTPWGGWENVMSEEIQEVYVTLRVKGNGEDVSDAIESILDSGEFQDAINEFGTEHGTDVHVVSAVCSGWRVVSDEADG